MKKKIIIIVSIFIALIFFTFIGIKLYHKWQIAHATIKVDLIDNLNIEVYSEIKLKDLIKNINGKLEKNTKIDTTELGKKEISFNYINDDNIKVPFSFNINIVDTTKPIISMYNSYSLYVGDDVDLAKEFFWGIFYYEIYTCVYYIYCVFFVIHFALHFI